MARIRRGEKTILIVGTVIVALYAYYVKVYRPSVGKLKGLEVEVGDRRKEVEILRDVKWPVDHKKAEAFRKAEERDEIAKLEAAEEELSQRFLGKKGISDLRRDLTELAEDYQVKIENFDPQGVEQTQQGPLRLRSSYEGIVNFLYALRKFPVASFRDLTISPAGGGTGQLTAQLKIVFYYDVPGEGGE